MYAALIVYLGGWYVGKWLRAICSLLLMMATVTGIYWLAEQFKFRPARERLKPIWFAQDKRSLN